MVAGGNMETQIYLAVADMRLLQTWHLLQRTRDKHPDMAGIDTALEAIRTARDTITNLRQSA